MLNNQTPHSNYKENDQKICNNYSEFDIGESEQNYDFSFILVQLIYCPKLFRVFH
jgi:hypothetical protein